MQMRQSASQSEFTPDVQRELKRLQDHCPPNEFLSDLAFGVDTALAFEERANVMDREKERNEVIQFAREGRLMGGQEKDEEIVRLRDELGKAQRQLKTKGSGKQQAKIAELEEQLKKKAYVEV